MRHYIKSLLQYEEENKCYDFLNNYLLSQNNKNIKSYCKGEIAIPSYILLKRLKKEYNSRFNHTEITYLLNKAVKISKVFYIKFIKLIKQSKIEHKIIKIEQKFEYKLQPLGQYLIDILIKLRDAIRKIRLNKYYTNIGITNDKAINQINFLFFGFLIFTINYKLNFSLNINQIMLLDLLLLGVISAKLLLLDKFYKFSFTDISGNNVLAYKYKVFFNNIYNEKLRKLASF